MATTLLHMPGEVLGRINAYFLEDYDSDEPERHAFRWCCKGVYETLMGGGYMTTLTVTRKPEVPREIRADTYGGHWRREALKNVRVLVIDAYSRAPASKADAFQEWLLRPGVLPRLDVMHLCSGAYMGYLTRLPSHLKTLLVSDTSLRRLPQPLPQELREITVDGSDNLKSVPEELPPNLEVLRFFSCTRLRHLPRVLPATLKSLVFFQCHSLERLPSALPPGLEYMQCADCARLRRLTREPLPASLKELDCFESHELQELPEPLPAGLEFLQCDMCDSIERLPPPPDGLRVLRIEYTGMKLPGRLPPHLKELGCSGCDRIRSLPELPDTLEMLSCAECPRLEKLPDRLPPNLKILLCVGCPRLRSFPPRERLPPSLDLEESDMDLYER